MNARTCCSLVGAAALATATMGCPIVGERPGDFFGLVLTDVGDLNDDGIHSVAIGAPDARDELNFPVGKVYIYSGMSGIRLHRWVGGGGERFGAAIAGVGDVNEDGFGDVLVAAPSHGVFPDQMRGRAAVYSGLDGSLIHEWTGEERLNEFGFSVSAAGDFDGDEVTDALIGARNYGSNNSRSGRAYVYSCLDGAELDVFSDGFPGDRYGHKVALAGDVNDDGQPDILIADSPVDTGGVETAAPKDIAPSRVYLYAGETGGILGLLIGEQIEDGFGTTMSTVGDVDDDQIDDFVIGAPNRFAGRGKVYLYTGATATPIQTFEGVGAVDGFGASVAGVGDIDLDGFGDFAIGVPGAFGPAGQVGRVDLLSGATGEPIWQLPGREPDTGFGAIVSGMPDANGDGYDTVAIASPAARSNTGTVTVVTPFAFCGSCAPALGVSGAAGAGTVAANAALYVIAGLVLLLALRRRLVR